LRILSTFANIGGDPEKEYFADDVTENLTTDVSRIRGTGQNWRNCWRRRMPTRS